MMLFNEVTHKGRDVVGGTNFRDKQRAGLTLAHGSVWLLQTRLKIPRPPWQTGRAKSKQIRSSRCLKQATQDLLSTLGEGPGRGLCTTAKTYLLNENWNSSESDLIADLFRPAVQFQSDLLGTSKIIIDCRYLSDSEWNLN